jgi:sigma-54 dependent transcriptional regulator, acetoin dehydrogenase operon transcriptional activator AcoR
MSTTSTELALRQARSFLLEHGNAPPGSIDERLARSWQRSVLAGLLPTGRLTNTEESDGSNFRHAIAFNRELLAHSLPVMEYLYQQVKNSHSMVVLADKRATLMHAICDPDFKNKADRVALATGASWSENIAAPMRSAQRWWKAVASRLMVQNIFLSATVFSPAPPHPSCKLMVR